MYMLFTRTCIQSYIPLRSFAIPHPNPSLLVRRLGLEGSRGLEAHGRPSLVYWVYCGWLRNPCPKRVEPQKNNGINMDKPSTGARFLNHPQQNREQWCFIMLYRQQKHLQGGEQGQNFDPYDRFGQLGDAWRCLDLEEIEVWSLRSRLGQNLKPEWTLKTGGPGNPQRLREELTGNLDVFLRREFTIQSLG